MNMITALFSSSSSQKGGRKGKNKPPKGRRSVSRYPETLSSGSSSSSGSSDFFAKDAAAPQTPRSVLGRNASGLDPECWPSPPAEFTAKCSASSSAPPPTGSVLFGGSGRDSDGKVTKEELEAVFLWLGGSSDPPTEAEVAMIVAEVDRDGDGCISLEDLGALGPTPGRCHGGEVEEEGLRDAFGVFDADGDGRISAEELLEVLLALGDEGCTLEDCRRMIGRVDSHGDGFVRFEDFVHMMDAGRT